MESKLYRGQGPLMWEEKLANGTYGPIQELGAISGASFTPNAEELKHRESYSGKRAVDKVIETTTECNASFTVENFAMEALGLNLRSEVVTGEAGSLVDAVVNADITAMAVGQIFRVPHLAMTEVVFKDSTAVTPKTLVEGTDYEAISAAHGYYRLLNKTGFTGALTVSGDYPAKKSINAMSRKKVTGRVSFLGINTAEDDEPRLVQSIVTLKAADSFQLINDDFASYTVTGECLYTNGGFFTVDGVVAA